MNTLLYTLSDCPECQRAEQLLREVGLQPEIRPLEEHPELPVRDVCCAPVVVINGKIRFRGRVDRVLLRRLITRESQP